MTDRRRWLPLATLAAIVILLLYARTLHFGFYWDDFDDLRPWTWADLGRTFVGQYQPWAREGIYFYRPLTSVYFAASTALFGLNSVALHIIPLVTLTVASTLVGVFVQRDTGSRTAGTIGTLIYATHPLTATAIGPWIANQYQGFVVIAVLSALLIWRANAARGLTLSIPLAIALVAAAWFKEDGLMLGPALLAIHAVRARVSRDVPPLTRTAVWSIASLTIGLITWRYLCLPSQFGYGVPDPWSVAVNLSRAWRYALIWHVGSQPWSLVLTCVKTALLAASVWWIITDRQSASARLALTGLALMAIMNLPLGLVSSENRWHVMGLCAVFIATAALSRLRGRTQIAAVAIVALLFAAGAWERIDAFAPCTTESLEHYRWAMTLPELPPQMHQWLSTRDAACSSGRFDPFAVPMRDMTWGHR